MASLGAGSSPGLVAHGIDVGGVDAVQEIRIAAESVRVRSDGLRPFLRQLVLLPPLVGVVGAFRVLEFVEQDLVLVDYSRQTSNAVRSVQTVVRV